MDVYASLSIRKERIEPRQAWQNLIEAHFTRARRMADARFARARSWEEILAVHRRFVHDYNMQRHWAHESREDGCHSPAEVLGGQTGTMYPPSVLDRILFATRYTRHLARATVIYPKKSAVSQIICHAPKRVQRIRLLT